jgi:tetratricopeptide (TPR) repeat protein
MISMLGLKASRCLVVGFLAAAGTAYAALSPPPDQDALKLDQSVQAIKEDALSLNRELLSLDENLLYPDISRVSVFVGVKVSGFMLNEMTVTLDDGQEIRYRYSESESKALLKQGLHRLHRANVLPGPHRVHAEFSGKFIDAKPNEKPLRGAVDTIFDKGLGPVDLVLPISRTNRMDRPGLPEVARLESTQQRLTRQSVALEKARAPGGRDYKPGSSEDPRLGMAIFLKNDKRFYTAISELLRIANSVPDPDQLPSEFQEQLAECYLNFGMPERAGAIYKRLVRETPRGPVYAARARMRLAEFQLQRGYVSEATKTLSELSEKVPQEVLAEWQDLLSRALMAQGRYAEAVEVLTEYDNVDRLSIYARYNLGIAEINSGKVEQGRNVLDRVGVMKVPDVETLALRDKANMTLAYHFLRSQLGGTAKPLFGRVRTDGPFSNRALLGLGWSELAPRGDRQARVPTPDDPQDQSPFSTFSSLGVLLRPGYYDSDPFKRLGLRPFRLSKISKDEEEALKRALVPWTELATRDPMDPAVQEGLLAIPFALDRLKAHEQALQLYGRAIDSLEESRKRMDAAAKSIREGRMVETIVRRDLDSESGWQWRLRDLPDAPETYFLQTLLGEDRFQEGLKNYRDVRLLSRNFDAWRDHLKGFDTGAAGQKQPDISADLLVARARQNWTPPYVIFSLPLAQDDQLSTPGSYDAPLPAMPRTGLALDAVFAPKDRDGAFERMDALRVRMDQLKPQLTSTGADSSKQLQAIAIKELNGQKKQIEGYLVEARLAVARIYDRQMGDQLDQLQQPAKPGAPR